MDDKIAEAMKQGQAQFDSIKELVVELRRAERGEDDNDKPLDEARLRIEEDALSVEVRSGWYVPLAGGGRGPHDEEPKPAEYCILLCTGGPAVRIIGQLSEHCEPETAQLEVQDWGTPWTVCRPKTGPDNYDSEPILLAYASVFWFGE